MFIRHPGSQTNRHQFLVFPRLQRQRDSVAVNMRPMTAAHASSLKAVKPHLISSGWRRILPANGHGGCP